MEEALTEQASTLTSAIEKLDAGADKRLQMVAHMAKSGSKPGLPAQSKGSKPNEQPAPYPPTPSGAA